MNKKLSINIYLFSAILSLVLSTILNFAFYKNLLKTYPLDGNIVFLSSVALLLFLLFFIFINLIRVRRFNYHFLFFFFPVILIIAYTMNTYGTIYDDAMIINILQTNSEETLELLSLTFFMYLAVGLLIPLIIVKKINLIYPDRFKDFVTRLGLILISFLLMGLTIALQPKQFATFFRVHKSLRYYVNPIHPLFNASRLFVEQTLAKNQTFTVLGKEAKVRSNSPKSLTIFIVGETARADHFELNGYKRATNPLLKNEEVLSFTNVTSCGTSTAHSVPCMFSDLGRKHFDRTAAKWRSNLLDILNATNEFKILWRDNNSSSKGVADRVVYQDFQSNVVNTICDPEGCRDEGMLIGLDDFIQNNPNKNIFIVLHQIGNHGPAYFKRYPLTFEKLTPICKTSELNECSNQNIVNTYDNALLYTDYFLAKTIQLLKKYDTEYQTLMWYESDHGESLGENGIYLHSIPYSIAPKEQTHVPRILWLGSKLAQTKKELKKNLNNDYSHDNIFHSILDILDIETKIKDKNLSIFN